MMAEMRLIDACGLVEKIQLRGQAAIFAHDDGTLNGLRAALFEIAYSPTVDAVPVVRCKDCVYLNKRLIAKNRGVHCLTWNQIVNPDNGYCNWGRRSDDD